MRVRLPARNLAVAAALVLLTVTLYLPVLDYGFIAFDDSLYVSENDRVREGITLESVRWAFTDTSLGFWHPLTMLSHQLDVELYGLEAGGHHLSALLIHLGATTLLFHVFVSMTGALWASAAVALLFAVHPLHVEPVVWIAERKEVLGGFFWMAAMAAYLRYVRRPGSGRYGAVFILFCCGMLTKPILVTFPFALLLLDYWPLGRFRFAPAGHGRGSRKTAPSTVLLEKAPFLAVSAGLSLVAYLAEGSVGAILEDLPLGTRLVNVPVAYLRYVRQTIWPSGLTFFYPHPGEGAPTGSVIAAGLVLLALSIAALFSARERPYVPVGWFWFLGVMVPVVGLVQVGAHFMADRYTYLPLIGLFVALVWVVREVTVTRRRKIWPTQAFVLLALAALYAAASLQIGYWRGDESLFGHAIAVTRGNWLAHNNLGVAYLNQGRVAEGIAELEASLRIHPWQPLVRINLGKALRSSGKLQEAISVYVRGLEQPDGPAPDLLKELGITLAEAGRLQEATRPLEQAIRLKAGMGDAHYHLGAILMLEEKPEAAIPHFRLAAQLDPKDHRARYYLGLTLFESGHAEQAETVLREACVMHPGATKACALLEIVAEARRGKGESAPRRERRAAAGER